MEETQAPRVTALIIARNCAVELRQCLQALEASEQRERLEILVIDSGSSDGSSDVAQEFPSLNTMRLPKHFGRTKALNIGCRTAKGTHIFLLSPYVIPAPDTIRLLADRLESSDETGAVGPYFERAYPLPEATALATACQTGELPNPVAIDPAASEVAVDYPQGAPLLVRRGFIRGMNFFDEQFGEYWADLELCWQLRNAGKRIIILPSARVSYQAQPASDRSRLYVADCIGGASIYLSKHYGFWPGFRFRMQAALAAAAGLRLKDAGSILTGDKVDGTQ